ncbi:MAG: hypothetical protein ACI8RO_001619, partial [Flavobacteriales bacterium]
FIVIRQNARQNARQKSLIELSVTSIDAVDTTGAGMDLMAVIWQ